MRFSKSLRKNRLSKRKRLEQLEKTLNAVCEKNSRLEKEIEEFGNIIKKNQVELKKLKNNIVDIEKAILFIRLDDNETIQNMNELLIDINHLSENMNRLSVDMNKLHINVAESESQYAAGKIVLNEVYQKTEENANAISNIEKYFKNGLQNIRHCIGAVSRETMRTKWTVKDSFLDDKPDKVQCIVCGCICNYDTVQKKFSVCKFAGGRLERYVCPKCGAIFGPIKFRNQSIDEYNDDYIVHYLGFSETDCTKEEKRTFFMLNPKKEGLYLNYGCGKWADTIKELREEGYNVYGYEPFATVEESEYIITDINVLKKMRFDGIFSHDLLEHLLNPVEDILFMKSLLLTSDGLMAHATACYEYKFEYTRFHTCFFTGNAVEELCKKTGMKVVGYDADEYKNYICYLYGVDDDKICFQQFMGGEKTEEGKPVAENGGVIFGPGFNLTKGIYYLKCIVSLKGYGFRLVVTAERGKQILISYELKDGMNSFGIELQSTKNDVEFLINSGEGQRCVLEAIWFSNEEKEY